MINGVKEEIIEKFQKSEVKNNKVIKIVEKMKKAGVNVIRNDKLISKKEKILYGIINCGWKLSGIY